MKYKFQRTGDGLVEIWTVSILRKDFPHWSSRNPEEILLGSVKLTSSIVDCIVEEWHESSFNEDDVLKARDLLTDSHMWQELMEARKEYHINEQSTGSVHLAIGDEHSRWHNPLRAEAYAQERLKTIWLRGLQLARRAEISREHVGVFSALEIDKYGHILRARISK